MQQFDAAAATASFPGGKSALDQRAASKKIEHLICAAPVALAIGAAGKR